MGQELLTASRKQTGRPSRDLAELRAKMQDTVREFTLLQRAKMRVQLLAENPTASEDALTAQLDDMCPVEDDFDPVVALAIIGVDRRNSAEVRARALSASAEFVRPKLKSVEVVSEAATPEEELERRALFARLVGALETGARQAPSPLPDSVTTEPVVLEQE